MNSFGTSSKFGIKILFCGLSEAGKTAVKKIIFEEKDISETESLSATIDYERMVIEKNGVRLLLMDLGGQKVFLTRFLTKYSAFVFNDVRLLIYIIDVSDQERFEDSLSYFTAVNEKLQEYSPNAQVVVFLHKADKLSFLTIEEKEAFLSQIREKFLAKAKFHIDFYLTSIYNSKELKAVFDDIYRKAIPELRVESTKPVKEVPKLTSTATSKNMPAEETTSDSLYAPVVEDFRGLDDTIFNLEELDDLKNSLDFIESVETLGTDFSSSVDVDNTPSVLTTGENEKISAETTTPTQPPKTENITIIQSVFDPTIALVRLRHVYTLNIFLDESKKDVVAADNIKKSSHLYVIQPNRIPKEKMWF